MADCPLHPVHTHTHGPRCDHPAVVHHDHVDHLHNGHLHHQQGGHVDEHTIRVDKTNPDHCTPGHDCDGRDHDERHEHGPACGHLIVPHGDHHDHWVRDHLHHPHGDHCDDHGPLHRPAPARPRQHDVPPVQDVIRAGPGPGFDAVFSFQGARSRWS